MMEKQEFLEPEPEKVSAIDEPHFEEAWTVLAARPVVPLKGVEPGQTLGRAVKLVAAFIGAGLLGVVVGLASIRFRQVPDPVGETGMPVQSDSTGNAADGTSTTEQTAIVPEVEAVPEKTTMRVTEASKRHSTQNTGSVQSTADTDNDSSSSRPQLADEWQERRPRRTTIRRQRREIEELHHRDLLRIQEIFEGRRPGNP
jgi:hypothetical protein